MKKSLLVILSVIPILLSGINLQQSIDLSLQNNKELQSMGYNISITEKDIAVAKSNAYPQITLEGGIEYKETHNPEAFTATPGDIASSLSANASDDDNTLANHETAIYDALIPDEVAETAQVAGKVSLSQIIYAGGTVSNWIRISRIYLEVQEDNYEVKKRDTVYKTKELFYQALLARDVVKITQESYTLANKHYSRVLKLNEEDMASEYDLLRAELEVSKIDPKVEEAQNDYELVISALEQHIGTHGIDALDGEIAMPVYTEFNLKQCYIEMLNKRIELEMSEKGLEIDKIQHSIALGDYMPKVALNAGASLFSQDDEFRTDSDYYGYDYSIGIGFSVPLFTGFSNSNKVKKSKFAIRQTTINNADLEDKLKLQVKQNYLNLRQVEKTVVTQNKNLNLAQTGYEIAQTRYDNQVGIQLELFDAQIQLEQAKLELKNAIYNVIINKEKLELSLGREI